MKRLNANLQLQMVKSRKRILTGIALIVLCFLLLLWGSVSPINTVILLIPLMSLTLIDLSVPEPLYRILLLLWVIVAVPFLLFTSQLLLNENVSDINRISLVLNYACIGMIFSVFYVLTGRLKIAVPLGMSLVLLLYTVNYFVFKFRGSEFAPIDILSFKTAMSVSGRYEYDFNAPFAYAIVLSVIYCCVIFCIRGEKEKRSFRNTFKGIAVTAFLLMLVSIKIPDVEVGNFAQHGSIVNGYLINFVAQSKQSVITKPPGYSSANVKKLEEKYDCNYSKENSQTPDIIVIMNESFADLSVLGNRPRTNKEVTPFFDSLEKNVIKGYTLSSVYGGGTPNSEYEFLSGNSFGFLPPGSIAYQQFIKEPTYTIVRDLKSRGYYTIATHPENSGNWLRDRIYPLMDFDEMSFIEDYPSENKIRNLISDQEMYETIVKKYENRDKSSPFFLFGITMQNHGGYDYEGDDYTGTVHLKGYDAEYKDVEQYLSLLHYSDEALEYLISYIDSVDHKVIILFYGDHFPDLDEGFYKDIQSKNISVLDEGMLKHKVPFFIWANYDIQEQAVPLTSMNYLSVYLYEAAGLNLSNYQCFIKDSQKVIPAMNSLGYYSEKQDRFINYDEAEGKEKKAIQEYDILEYNCLFDKKNKSRVFFP